MPLTIERNDLAAVEADAIIVAANEQLRITGGVGAAVAVAAGFEEMQAACDAIGYCACGSAVATPGFGLPARVVVHAVGPLWRGGEQGEAELLRATYNSALECAVGSDARSVALPLISSGTYGFPASVSLSVAREAIRSFLESHDVDVRLVLYSHEAVVAGIDSYLDIAEYIDDRYVAVHSEFGSIVLPASEASDGTSNMPGIAPRRARGHRRILDRLGDMAERAQGRFAGRPVDSAVPETDMAPAMAAAPVSAVGLENLLESLDAPFSTTLLALIDERGLTDSEVYKRANMSRQLFSKIRSDAEYRPAKKTVLALSVALRLDLRETRDLLARAGFALSRSSKADVIVEYFIVHGNYDILKINEALYAFDQPLL